MPGAAVAAGPAAGGGLRVLLPAAANQPLVAGVPPVLRAARKACEELCPALVVLSTDDPRFGAAWAPQLASLGCPRQVVRDGDPLGSILDPAGPLLVLSPSGIPATEALGRFVEAAARSAAPAAWVAGGRPVAAYIPRAEAVLALEKSAGGVARKALALEASGGEGPGGGGASGPAARGGRGSQGPAGGWISAYAPDFVPRAEADLYASLASDSDGYLARYDRRISIALSKALLKTPVVPNHVTTAGLLLGCAGAWGLASGDWPRQVLGSLLLWCCSILDGCDGELARLKLRFSRWGAAYDFAADHVCHLLTFAAIPLGIRAADPSARVLAPGALLLSGVVLCMLSVWWRLLRHPDGKGNPMRLAVERLASRDYVYIVAVLAAAGRLEWFLWAAAEGAHVFNVVVWLVPRSAPPRPAAAGAGVPDEAAA